MSALREVRVKASLRALKQRQSFDHMAMDDLEAVRIAIQMYQAAGGTVDKALLRQVGLEVVEDGEGEVGMGDGANVGAVGAGDTAGDVDGGRAPEVGAHGDDGQDARAERQDVGAQISGAAGDMPEGRARAGAAAVGIDNVEADNNGGDVHRDVGGEIGWSATRRRVGAGYWKKSSSGDGHRRIVGASSRPDSGAKNDKIDDGGDDGISGAEQAAEAEDDGIGGLGAAGDVAQGTEALGNDVGAQILGAAGDMPEGRTRVVATVGIDNVRVDNFLNAGDGHRAVGVQVGRLPMEFRVFAGYSRSFGDRHRRVEGPRDRLASGRASRGDIAWWRRPDMFVGGRFVMDDAGYVSDVLADGGAVSYQVGEVDDGFDGVLTAGEVGTDVGFERASGGTTGMGDVKNSDVSEGSANAAAAEVVASDDGPSNSNNEEEEVYEEEPYASDYSGVIELATDDDILPKME